MRRLLASSLLLLAACTRAPAAAARDASTLKAEAPLPECTLATPLVPGVPGSPGHLIPSELNPNGASELAALMRTMVADLEAGRAALEKGGTPPPLWSRHRKLRCAWPTDSADRNPQFDAMAVTYLAQVQALDAKPTHPRAAFNAVVTACQACHENSCPGPIERIVQLKVADAP
ncbi:MAG: hypothetical protein IT380_24320 [Myxococcales bacterium]|nr:hypothetical protein [Myxococcales bacterium]